MKNKKPWEWCKGKKLIPVTMEHETMVYGKEDRFISTKIPVDSKWLINEFNKMSNDGIKCKIDNGILWRIEPDYIYTKSTKQKWYL